MHRNIWIAYVLTFLRNSWFWMGIWVFYYLKFTNYAGIGLIETIMIIAVTSGEIPTGVIADFFGKKNTLTIAFSLQTIAMIFLSFTPSLLGLLIGILILGIGGAFYSGTIDALIYDSLIQLEDEKKFDKIISKVTGISLIAPAICGIFGGYLYTIKPNIPYILNALCYAIGIICTLFLIEPKIKERTHVSLTSFFQQTKNGFNELFKSTKVIEQTLLLVATGAISVICLQMLNDFLGVEFGFKPTQLAIYWSFLYILCAGISYITPYFTRFMSYKTIAIVVGIIISGSLIVSPFLGVGAIILGGLSIGVRALAQTIYENVSSVLINQNTQSQYRTTTLSTFNLLKNIPYVLSAFSIGFLADKITSIRLACVLGVVLLSIIILQIVFYSRKKVVAIEPA